jgi:hypothetical protein
MASAMRSSSVRLFFLALAWHALRYWLPLSEGQRVLSIPSKKAGKRKIGFMNREEVAALLNYPIFRIERMPLDVEGNAIVVLT